MDGFNPDDFLAAQNESMPPEATGLAPIPSDSADGFNPDDFLAEVNQEQYGGLGQQAIAGLEGIAKGVAGPLATAAEKHILGVPEEDIKGREEANPITHGAGTMAGLTAGLITGTGMGGAMTKAGQGAAELAGLANLAAEAPLLHRIGSAAVSQAAEMAVLQSGDEVSKMIVNDPEASAESAIANIGMTAALGGAGGAFITGAVSPLWSATAGPKLERVLNGVRDHMNGAAAILPEETEAAIKTLAPDGLQIDPTVRAVLTGNPTAIEKFNVLKEVQNPEVLAGLNKLHTDTSEAVMRGLGVAPDDIAVYSENEAGHSLLDAFKKEYDAKYGPIAARLQARNEAAAGIGVTDEAKLAKYGNMLETGMNKVGTDSPYYKLYEDYGNRMLAKDTIGQLDQLKTEINNRVKGLKIGGDYNEINALNDIKGMIADFQESQISKAAQRAEMSAIDKTALENITEPTDAFSRRLAKETKTEIEGALKEAKATGKAEGASLLNERADVNRQYAEFAKMSDELTSHLGVGGFRGAGTLQAKLTDAISPEDLLKKFSFKGNADFIPFLKQHFPETFKEVQANELKKFLKPAVLGATGENPINIKKIGDIVSKAMAGQKEYVESILPAGAMEKIEAANKLLNAIPSVKSSGTAGWLTKTMRGVPASAMAAVAAITSHNPIVGGILGESAHYLGRSMPDAINLAYLKFLGSEQPIKAEGFKAMVDFIHNTYKGDNMITKAVGDVFKSGAQVLTSSAMPAKADIEKLDKIVTKLQDTPDKVYQLQNGHVGHYLSAHQAGLTEASTRALSYLQSLKPHPYRASPLDAEIPPSDTEVARYERALTIAQQPTVILKHIKDGTLLDSDMKDLGAMYPGLYKTMAQKLSSEMTDAASRGEHVAYKTRMSLSLFLGQPLDSTMAPMAIQTAQATYLPPPRGLMSGAGGKGSPSKLGKTVKSDQTPLQASESRKLNHK
jgi:hypothetical protein